MGIAVVLAAGVAPERERLASAFDAELVVAADGGLRAARQHDLRVDAVVGDLDSALDEDLAWARGAGATVVDYPSDKDATDLELAMAYADNAEGIDRILVFGVDGGRLDHEMGNWAVCCAPWRATVEVHAAGGIATILRSDRQRSMELRGEPGQTLSLIARMGAARGVEVTGVRWPLHNATLEAHSSLGISNEFVEPVARVSVGEGVLVVVQPELADPAG